MNLLHRKRGDTIIRASRAGEGGPDPDYPKTHIFMQFQLYHTKGYTLVWV